MNPEADFSPEQPPVDEEPMESFMTAEEFIEPLSDVLLEEDIEFLKETDSFQTINYLYGVLPERGIEDVDAFLVERGLLDSNEIKPNEP